MKKVLTVIAAAATTLGILAVAGNIFKKNRDLSKNEESEIVLSEFSGEEI